MSLATFTFMQVVLSLVGIGAGVVVLSSLLRGQEHNGWTVLFLVTTVATSVTGFGFPVAHVLPSHVVGVVSLIVLAVAIVARYRLHLRGVWRPVYVIGTALALYLNVAVGVIQAFLHVSALHALAPQQTEPPFVVAHVVVLVVFTALTVLAAKRFRGEPIRHV
jgi:hypothetical protein